MVHLGDSCADAKKNAAPIPVADGVAKAALNADAKPSNKRNGHDGDRQPKEQAGRLGAVPRASVGDRQGRHAAQSSRGCTFQSKRLSEALGIAASSRWAAQITIQSGSAAQPPRAQ